MNEFTKEELLVISHDLGILNHDSKISYEHATVDFIVNLKSKIQSMIDNYCEHDWSNFLDFNTTSEAYIEKCLYCHELRFNKNFWEV